MLSAENRLANKTQCCLNLAYGFNNHWLSPAYSAGAVVVKEKGASPSIPAIASVELGQLLPGSQYPGRRPLGAVTRCNSVLIAESMKFQE